MIIIKSRLKPQVDFPEDLVNDLHIAFDVNLQNTINAFNVPVENLDYLLENKKRLMLANCYKKTKIKLIVRRLNSLFFIDKGSFNYKHLSKRIINNTLFILFSKNSSL